MCVVQEQTFLIKKSPASQHLDTAMHLGRHRTSYERIGFAAVVFFVSGAVLSSISFAFDVAGRTIFSPANVGLHDEWNFFSIGLCMLGIAVWAPLRSPSLPGSISLDMVA